MLSQFELQSVHSLLARCAGIIGLVVVALASGAGRTEQRRHRRRGIRGDWMHGRTGTVGRESVSARAVGTGVTPADEPAARPPLSNPTAASCVIRRALTAKPQIATCMSMNYGTGNRPNSAKHFLRIFSLLWAYLLATCCMHVCETQAETGVTAAAPLSPLSTQ